MSYSANFMVVPHLTYGNTYFVFRELNGGQWLEVEIKIDGLTVFNFGKLTTDEKNFFIRYILPSDLSNDINAYI